MTSEPWIAQWIAHWQNPLVGILLGWGADRAQAWELAQTTLTEAYLGRARFSGDLRDAESAGPWLYGIARNLWRSAVRAEHRRREESLPDEWPAPPKASETERETRLRAAMKRLPEKHREVLYLTYLDEAGASGAAQILGLKESTLRGRLARAREALRDVWHRMEAPTDPDSFPPNVPFPH